MADKSGRRTQFERGVEQAIVALKKGAHLLKCGRRGKPKFCPFRLSTDEKSLIWYSGEKEKCLKLNTVSKINLGQKTVNFFRQPQPEKESQSFSLIYQNSERSLDLICKDKEQAECWVLGLTSLLSISHHPRHLAYVRTGRAASSCVNSPVSHLSTKYKLKLVHDSSQLPQVYSVYGSPPRKLREKHVSDGFLDTSDILYSLKPRTLSNAQHLFDEKFPLFSHTISDGFKSTKDCCQKMEQTVSSPENGDSLKDVFMWGEGVGVFFGDRSNSFETNGIKSDILLPRLLESTRMLDIESISCGDKYAALVTKQGEVFCWGEGIGGKLGHKVNLDVTYPKAIESLSSFCMQEIACGSTQTCAITLSGELYTWGKDRLFEGGNRSHWIPHRISCFGEIKISKVACGEWHTAIVSSSGHLFTYGEGTFGALGHGNLQSSSQPKEVESLKGLRVKSVACGPWHTAAIVEVIISRFKSNALNGKLFTWGDSDKGKLGHEDKKRKLLPTCIASLVDYDFVQVSCGRSLTVALTATGLVITMGSVINRQLINAQGDDTSITTVEGYLKNEYVKDLSSGSFHVAALTTKGNVYTWGKGKSGRLGLGDTKDRDSPSLVEALQDRDVQNVVCGFNFTAAICRHKSLSSKDQSLCTGCRMAFGFTRKKHNCYNCGSVFCHSCCNKRALNASLAPNKTRRCRVCDQCYTQLEKLTTPRVNDDISCQSEYSITSNGIFDVRIHKDEALLFLPKIFTPKLSIHYKSAFLNGNIISMQNADQKNKDSFFSVGTQKWGQVPCPPIFKEGKRDESIMFITKSKEGFLVDAHVNAQSHPESLKQNLPEIDKLLTEELKRLHAKAKTLSQQYQSNSLKLQQYKCRIEENCLLARDEAAKCKATMSIIKVLRTQMNALSETIAEKEVKEIMPLIDPLKRVNSDHEDNNMKALLETITGRQEKETMPLIDPLRRVNTDQEDNTVIVESSSVPRIGRCTDISAHTTEIDARSCSSNASGHEQVEQFELGVHISFTILPNGQRGLKRVRFSRKRFSEKEAEKWWHENRCRIFKKYSTESIDTSSTRLRALHL